MYACPCPYAHEPMLQESRRMSDPTASSTTDPLQTLPAEMALHVLLFMRQSAFGPAQLVSRQWRERVLLHHGALWRRWHVTDTRGTLDWLMAIKGPVQSLSFTPKTMVPVLTCAVAAMAEV